MQAQDAYLTVSRVFLALMSELMSSQKFQEHEPIIEAAFWELCMISPFIAACSTAAASTLHV